MHTYTERIKTKMPELWLIGKGKLIGPLTVFSAKNEIGRAAEFNAAL